MNVLSKLAAAAAAAVGALGLSALPASASTTYAVNYHGAATSWAWSGSGTYLQHMQFAIQDVTNSRICPTYGVKGITGHAVGWQWSTTSCANPGRVTGHTWTWDNYVPPGTYQMFESMPGWATFTHNFSVG
jgi:hypothetical protein